MNALALHPYHALKAWLLLRDRKDLLALQKRLEAELRGVDYALRENSNSLKNLGVL